MDYSKFNQSYLKSGYKSIKKYIEDNNFDEEGEGIPTTVSTNFSLPNRPEHSLKKDEIEEAGNKIDSETEVVYRDKNNQGDE